MKKILEKFCSVRVILTVLCLLSFAMETRADVTTQPYIPSEFVSYQLPPQWELQVGIIISLLVICLSALGYCFEKMKPVTRFTQVLLLGVFFLMWGLSFNKENTFDLPGFVCLVILMAVTICTCLFSGVWAKCEEITQDAVCITLVFLGFSIAVVSFDWGLVICCAKEITASKSFAYLLVLTVLVTAAALILGFIMKRKNNSESNSEKSGEVYKRFILFAIFLFTDLAIILGIEFVYLPYCVRQEQIRKQEWEQKEREKEESVRKWRKEHPHRPRNPNVDHDDRGAPCW